MIDSYKTYKTGSGCPVKLFLAEGDYIHGMYKRAEVDKSNGVPVDWVPMLWNAETGWPYATVDNEGSPWVEDFKLIECKETKQISHTVYVGTDGSCYDSIPNIPDDTLFASFTVNADLEKGSYKTFVLRDEPDNITKFNLTNRESRALQAIACYGSNAFLKVFYEKLGKHYLKPSEADIEALFSKIQKALPPIM